MTSDNKPRLQQSLAARFSDAHDVPPDMPGSQALDRLAARGSCRAFERKPIPTAWLDILCAIALASPTKSDLQQRDIILLRSPQVRERLAALVSGQAWVADAPMIAIICGNNRRQRLIHQWRNVPFANDHLDAFVNATGDAAIALGAFVAAAEAMGLGCCPISAVRNEAAAVSDLLALPDHVFPFAGLAIGFPAHPPKISKRLPLHVTCHTDRYQENGLQDAIAAYDQDRAITQPYQAQRLTDTFGRAEPYTWSDDKARQYSQPERAGFGAFIRSKRFRLD